MRFIITFFGDKYLGMCITCIQSIINSNPKAKISVFWQDANHTIINDISKSYNNVQFCKTNFDITNDPIKKISSKTKLWNFAAQKHKNEELCFLDVDTLVVENISKYFKMNFDVIFTFKDEIYPLNSGVLLCKGQKYQIFFEKWEKMTKNILLNKELFLKANSRKYSYGGADQMSLYKIINYNKDQSLFKSIVSGNSIKFKGIECHFLNETNSITPKSENKILHYKAGWQSILINNLGFYKHRSRKKSWDMYILYLKIFLKAIKHLNKNSKNEYNHNDLNIAIPFYLDEKDLSINEFYYFIFSFISFFKRIQLKLKKIYCKWIIKLVKKND